jgi:hypothetical protein
VAPTTTPESVARQPTPRETSVELRPFTANRRKVGPIDDDARAPLERPIDCKTGAEMGRATNIVAKTTITIEIRVERSVASTGISPGKS